MSDLNPFPPPTQHTDAIRDLQERVQLMDRAFAERLNQIAASVDRFIRQHTGRVRSLAEYDYSKEDNEQ